MGARHQPRRRPPLLPLPLHHPLLLLLLLLAAACCCAAAQAARSGESDRSCRLAWHGPRSYGSLRALLHADLVHAAKRMARLSGVDPGSVAGHSFRRDGASYSFRAGVPDVLIQHQGDWRSMAYREYLTLPPAQALEATSAMFRLMQQPAQRGGFGAGLLQAGVEPMDNAVGARCAMGEAGQAVRPVEG